MFMLRTNPENRLSLQPLVGPVTRGRKFRPIFLSNGPFKQLQCLCKIDDFVTNLFLREGGHD